MKTKQKGKKTLMHRKPITVTVAPLTRKIIEWMIDDTGLNRSEVIDRLVQATALADGSPLKERLETYIYDASIAEAMVQGAPINEFGLIDPLKVRDLSYRVTRDIMARNGEGE